jgi:glycolate oxidase
MMDIIARTVAAGYKGFCLTADTQIYSRRERDLLKRYLPMAARQPGTRLPRPARADHAALHDLGPDPAHRGSLRHPADPQGHRLRRGCRDLAVRSGVDVIYVSNHGGRQLDHRSRPQLDTLPEVVQAVAGRAEVVVDGGIMRGTDILKALALGARAVGIGRLEALAMAAGGTPAVVRMLELLEIEMQLNLASMGLSSIDQLHPAAWCRPSRWCRRMC